MPSLDVAPRLQPPPRTSFSRFLLCTTWKISQMRGSLDFRQKQKKYFYVWPSLVSVAVPLRTATAPEIRCPKDILQASKARHLDPRKVSSFVCEVCRNGSCEYHPAASTAVLCLSTVCTISVYSDFRSFNSALSRNAYDLHLYHSILSTLWIIKLLRFLKMVS